MKIVLLTPEQIEEINVLVCEDSSQDSHCYDLGKVESALHSAFYPGDYPFQHGSIPEVAGALCYYLTKCHAFVDGNKRTAAIAALVFLDLNHYAINANDDEYADIVEYAASSRNHQRALAKLKMWFIENCIPAK